ncbi:YqgE/AlgH family protein [Palleronia caenipelagi]|uniref:UPF0301 protein FEV53_01130 n=1 Tax=Palleronia caenipelagi TaxID=2489174 RepID=A0A547QA08_9RHOB|nr:YqgE/AlgH family protein [Palleronia caenipelagi]TRD23191.1 YqgE/AlgH family protein [Palleronia caenipelagi]
MQSVTSLTGKLLIAMPGMGDPRFDHSVIVLCSHGTDGAMGLIVNKPSAEISLTKLLKQLSIATAGCEDRPVFYGGPVENSRGFVLHSADYFQGDATLDVDGRYGMTATLDVLRALASGGGPDAAIVILGYAGWGSGQLEAELAENVWLVADAGSELVFETQPDALWSAAIASLGIDPLLLSGEGGQA